MVEPRAHVRNASDPEQVRKAKQSVRVEEERETRDLQAVMGTPEGRRLLWRFIAECGIYKSIFVPSSEIYYRAGRHDLGLWLVDQITTAAPLPYLLMQREAAKLDAAIDDPSPSPSDD